jgi:hypothetical protein
MIVEKKDNIYTNFHTPVESKGRDNSKDPISTNPPTLFSFHRLTHGIGQKPCFRLCVH